MDDRQSILLRNGIQLGNLRLDGKQLAFFILGGFAAVNEVFKHGHILPKDITLCEHKLKKKTQIQFTKSTLKSLRGATSRERRLHRLHSVALVLGGFSASEAARLYGDSPRAVAYWLTRFNDEGVEGLEEEERPGRPSKLSAPQMRKAQRFVEQSETKSKHVSPVALSEFISNEFGISLTPRHCRRIINRLKKP